MFDGHTPKEWIRLGRELETYQGRFLVCILGAIDTGKTSLCRYLISRLQRLGQRIAWIDADLGQSTLGPPTTVGMRILSAPREKSDPVYTRFVGYTSPVRHLLQSLVAVRVMVDKAIRQEVRGIVLDTSGFVFGRTALEFKFQKVELVNPTHLVALERGRELEPLLKNFSHRRSLFLYRFLVPEFIRSKSRERRWEYRNEQFRKYFQGAGSINFTFRGAGLHGRLPDFQDPLDWEGLLIGFCNDINDTLALGIIRQVDLEQKQFSCLTPLQQVQKVRSIQFGSLYLDESGRELFRKISPGQGYGYGEKNDEVVPSEQEHP